MIVDNAAVRILGCSKRFPTRPQKIGRRGVRVGTLDVNKGTRVKVQDVFSIFLSVPLKMATITPAHPRRAETRYFPSKAARSEEPEAYESVR